MIIGNFMSTDVITLKPENTFGEAASLFLDKKIDGAPVVKDGQLIGLLTKTHLIRAMNQEMPLDQPIREYMSRLVKTLPPEQPIDQVDIMFTGRYPVVDNGELVGIITKSDIMVALTSIIEEMSGQLEIVINSTYNPIIAIDRNGIITIWNQAAQNLTGLTKPDTIGKFINDIIPESQLLNIVERGCTEYGIRLTVGNKSFITNRAPILKNDEVTGAVAVLYDVSELENVSRELEYVKKLNQEMDAIINSSFDGLYITDAAGMTIRINKAIKRMTGLGEEELLNKSMNELVETGVLSRSATLIVLETKEACTTTLATVTGKTLLVSATPVFDENGEIFRVVTSVRDVSELNMLKQKVEQLEGLKKHFEFQMKEIKARLSEELIFKNREMEKIVYQAMKIAEVDSTVLISGESGVGKEVIGDIIQRNSIRGKSPFVKLNCAAIPENLLESELFGYEAGAFTGARKEGKPGLFEVAHEGTLLLDEIGDIPLHLQAKLLRVLQQKEIFRVGGTRPIAIDVRIIAVTNRILEEMVAKGEFREDLYYRLNVVPIHVPALRERREDIPLLIRHFLEKFNRRYNLTKTISQAAMELLMSYSWPGNIRQLENMIERLVVTTSEEVVEINNLPSYFLSISPNEPGSGNQPVSVSSIIPLKQAVESLERQLLEKAFAVTNSCYKAARLLEVDASTVSRKASRYNIEYKRNN